MSVPGPTPGSFFMLNTTEKLLVAQCILLARASKIYYNICEQQDDPKKRSSGRSGGYLFIYFNRGHIGLFYFPTSMPYYNHCSISLTQPVFCCASALWSILGQKHQRGTP